MKNTKEKNGSVQVSKRQIENDIQKQLIATTALQSFDPQQKKQKEIQKSREALKTGDKVITAGGIYGKIKEIGDTYMLIEVADGVRIRVDKTSIFASAEDAQQQK